MTVSIYRTIKMGKMAVLPVITLFIMDLFLLSHILIIINIALTLRMGILQHRRGIAFQKFLLKMSYPQNTTCQLITFITDDVTKTIKAINKATNQNISSVSDGYRYGLTTRSGKNDVPIFISDANCHPYLDDDEEERHTITHRLACHGFDGRCFTIILL